MPPREIDLLKTDVQEHVKSVCPISGGFGFGHVVKVVPTGFYPFQMHFAFFVIKQPMG